mgnify:FL=1
MIQKPLEGIRILDLTKLLPGPFATMILGDLGAEIIKVEHPDPIKDIARFHPPFVKGKKSRIGSLFYQINRNKKSITLDYTKPKGREIFLKLARDADVVVESFKPGTMDHFDIGKERLKEANPDLIFCSINGYGQTGPRSKEPGHDMNYLSIAGLLQMNGRLDDPPLPYPIPFGDYIGALFGVIGVLGQLAGKKLKKNDNDNQGKDTNFIHIDASIYESVFSLLHVYNCKHMTGSDEFEKDEEVLCGYYPFYRLYECKDGKHVALGAIEDKFWRRFCDAIGRPELKSEQFAGIDYISDALNLKSCWNTEDVNETIEKIMLQRDRDDWVRFLNDHDICCTPVNSIPDAWNDPQATSRQLLIDVEDGEYGTRSHLRSP